MDTTSSALARTFNTLSLNQEVQEKARQEILEAIQEHGENLPYDVVVELPYLDAVCREILRL
jgi:cytochrome P450